MLYPSEALSKEETTLLLKQEMAIAAKRTSSFVSRSYFAVNSMTIGENHDCKVLAMPWLNGDDLFKSAEKGLESDYYITIPPERRTAFLVDPIRSEAGMVFLQRIINLKLLLRDMVEALGDLHSKGVVYRDLKPGNIIRVGTSHILVDLEYAKYWDSEEAAESSDNTEVSRAKLASLGTPEFLAPEVIRKEGRVFASDLWPLGATLYTLAFGRYTHGAESEGCLYKIATHQPFQLFLAPEELNSLLSALLTPSPDDRITLNAVKEHPFYTKSAEEIALHFRELLERL